ncbi:hypothetical protein [Nostoc sp.]
MATGSTHHLAENLLISSCTAVAIAIVSYVSNEVLPEIGLYWQIHRTNCF